MVNHFKKSQVTQKERREWEVMTENQKATNELITDSKYQSILTTHE